MSNWMATTFQDSISPSMEHILFFHDHAMIVLTMITILTLYLVASLVKTKSFNKFMMEGQEIEMIWTILPASLLIFIAIPSMKTLYLMEDTKNPQMSIKVIGHQWYWSYDHEMMEAPAEMFMENSKTLRLLKTNEMLSMPANVQIRATITSDDVIHAWTLPSLGIKVDALPGRLNQTFLLSKRIGLFTGQCSEICGANHSFMPILLTFKSVKEFSKE